MDWFSKKALKSTIHKKGIGLALGSGGFKGFFHIGVLEALEMAEIPIKLIVGTSAGALAGGLYAAGINPYELKKLAWNFHKSSIFTYGNPIFSKNGVLKGKKAIEFFDDLIKHKNFEDLNIPFYAVAADLMTGEKIVFDSGDLAIAVRASVSVPGIFEPVLYENYVLIDGGVVEQVPVSVVREKWDGPVLASSLTPPLYEPTDIVVKKETNVLGNIAKALPILQDYPLFESQQMTYLESNMLAIMVRSWDMIAYEKYKLDMEKYPADILVTIGRQSNPGINDLNKYNLQSIISEGKNATLKALTDAGIIL